MKLKLPTYKVTKSPRCLPDNAETYMNVGEAMGKAMVDLLKDQK